MSSVAKAQAASPWRRMQDGAARSHCRSVRAGKEIRRRETVAEWVARGGRIKRLPPMPAMGHLHELDCEERTEAAP